MSLGAIKPVEPVLRAQEPKLLSPCDTTPEPVLHIERNQEQPPLTTTREGPRVVAKTQHSQKEMNE